MKKIEQRQQTKHAIEDAFLDLIQGESFEKITIDRLVTRAKIGRSTFYKYYEDKWQLMNEILLEETSWFQNKIEERFTRETIYDQKNLEELVHILLKKVRLSLLWEYPFEGSSLKTKFTQMIQEKIHPLIKVEGIDGQKPAYLTILYSEIAISMLSWQLANGYDQTSIDFSIALLKQTRKLKIDLDD